MNDPGKPVAVTQKSNALDSTAVSLVRKLVDIGLDGLGPLDSAASLAAAVKAKSATSEDAIDQLVRSQGRLAATGGFVTGLGGFVTLPVAVPANVVEFYLVATRLVGAIAHLRGYDLTKEEVRTAILLSLTGTDSKSILTKVGFNPTGKIADIALQQLPPAALMMINKGVGVHLITQVGGKIFTRLGRLVPVAGGAVGASLDWWLLRKVGQFAREQFPQRALPSGEGKA